MDLPTNLYLWISIPFVMYYLYFVYCALIHLGDPTV